MLCLGESRSSLYLKKGLMSHGANPSIRFLACRHYCFPHSSKFCRLVRSIQEIQLSIFLQACLVEWWIHEPCTLWVSLLCTRFMMCTRNQGLSVLEKKDSVARLCNTAVSQCGILTLKRSVSIRLLGTLTELICRAGPLSLTLLSLELGVTHNITGWVVPRSWLSTWYRPSIYTTVIYTTVLTGPNSYAHY